MITEHDKHVKQFAPLAAKLLPSDTIDRDKRVDHAIGGGGELLADALSALGFYAMDLVVDNTQRSNSSITDFMNAGELLVSLPEGVWLFKFKASARMTNTGAQNNNFRTMVDDNASPTITRATTSSGSVPFFDGQILKIVGGREFMAMAQFKSSNGSGTAEINDCVCEYDAIRIS